MEANLSLSLVECIYLLGEICDEQTTDSRDDEKVGSVCVCVCVFTMSFSLHEICPIFCRIAKFFIFPTRIWLKQLHHCLFWQGQPKELTQSPLWGESHQCCSNSSNNSSHMWPGQVSYLIPVEELYETFHKPDLSVDLGPLMGLMRIISAWCICLLLTLPSKAATHPWS